MNPSQQVYSQANDLTNYGANQANQFGQQYQQANGQYQDAQQNLSNYRSGMQDLGQAYGQNLQGAQQQFGFDPQSLKNAQQALAATQTTMANLPQAVQQSANGRMLTGAQTANRLAQQGQNVQGVLAGQSNSVNALNNIYGLTQQQANQQTGFQGQSQQLNLGALQNLATNTQAQENQALQQIQYFNSLRAQGIQLTTQEQATEAQAAQAYAQAKALNQQTQLYAAQANLYNQQAANVQPTLNAAQQRSAQSIGGTTPSQIQNYRSPESSIANRSYVDPLTALGYSLGVVH